jgi:hypothetical protein
LPVSIDNGLHEGKAGSCILNVLQFSQLLSFVQDNPITDNKSNKKICFFNADILSVKTAYCKMIFNFKKSAFI